MNILNNIQIDNGMLIILAGPAAYFYIIAYLRNMPESATPCGWLRDKLGVGLIALIISQITVIVTMWAGTVGYFISAFILYLIVRTVLRKMKAGYKKISSA
jgi:hypothetical protein